MNAMPNAFHDYFDILFETDTGDKWLCNQELTILFFQMDYVALHISGKIFNLTAGQMAIIPPNELYRIGIPSQNTKAGVIKLILTNKLLTDIASRSFDTGAQLLGQRFSLVLCPADLVLWLSQVLERLILEKTWNKELSLRYCLNLVELVFIEATRLHSGEEVQEHLRQQADSSRLIKNIIQYINQNYKSNIGLSKIANKFWINPSYLSRLFKSQVGVNITEFIVTQRLYQAKKLLLATDNGIAEIAMEVGFNNVSYFNMVFKDDTGLTPREFRQTKKLAD